MNTTYLNELWKEIKGFEDLYQISNFGRVLSKRKNKILSLYTDWKGYVRVELIKDKKKKWFKVHRLVAEAFIPNPNNLPCINHKDENKDNNTVENLEWCDWSYNNNYGNRNITVSQKLKKPVLQYDLEGNFIKEYESLTEAQKVFGWGICSCCKGRYKTAYGYVWKYKEGD